MHPYGPLKVPAQTLRKIMKTIAFSKLTKDNWERIFRKMEAMQTCGPYKIYPAFYSAPKRDWFAAVSVAIGDIGILILIPYLKLPVSPGSPELQRPIEIYSTHRKPTRAEVSKVLLDIIRELQPFVRAIPISSLAAHLA